MNNETDYTKRNCTDIKEPGMDKKICNRCLRRLECMVHPESHKMWCIQKAVEHACEKCLNTSKKLSLIGVQNTMHQMIEDGLIIGWNDLRIEQNPNGVLEVHVQVCPVQPVESIMITIGKLP